MRKKKAIINVCFSLVLQLVTIISGFIVPRLFIGRFGSDVNGLINSITSFIGYITLLQTGVGSAVKAALYKPLAKKNKEELSIIVKTADSFFKKIAFATIIYICILMIVFPFTVAKEYDWLYSISLVAIIGITTAAQYFFGITYQMVLEADQREYIYSSIQIFSVIINCVLTVFLINNGFSVQFVKLASAIVFVVRPILIGLYTKKKYDINLKVSSNPKLLSQRWDAFAQGLAYFIHSKTDVFVLTLLATFKDVSVYSVYALVTAGLSSFFNALDSAVRAAFGNIIAKDEKSVLVKDFELYNTLVHILTTICFATASITVFNFITIYARNITDANYVRPAFGVLIITAEFVYCLRSPYNSIIHASGRFKETKISAFIEAGINIVLSCVLVPFLGLEGVAIGTLVAMIYRTLFFVYYLKNHILKFSYVSQIKRYSATIIAYSLCVFVLSQYKVITNNYFEWIIYSAVVFIVVSILVLVVNLLFDRIGTVESFKIALKRNR